MLANLKAAIAARGMRQIDLCFDLRIPAPKLSEIVRGHRKAEPELRRKIAARLEADEAWLFSETRIVPSRQVILEGAQVEAAV